MTLDQILVSIFTVSGIIFTYWFFLMKNENIVEVQDEVDILVHGGYQPSVIKIPTGKTTKINFLRKDSSSCLEEVVISDFRVKRYLPLNKKVTVSVSPEKPGEYEFACGMNMFHGKIIAS